jgi:excisionase family DNA binding protein
MADFITTTEAARRLGVTRQTMATYVRSGRVRGVKLGKEWRIPLQEFERLMQAPPAPRGVLILRCWAKDQ